VLICKIVNLLLRYFLFSGDYVKKLVKATLALYI